MIQCSAISILSTALPLRITRGRLQYCDVCYEHTSLFPSERKCVLLSGFVVPANNISESRANWPGLSVAQSVHAEGACGAQPHRQDGGVLAAMQCRSHAQAGDVIGHPKCQFCDVYLYDNDKLYFHMRQHHEPCTVCATLGQPNQCDRSRTASITNAHTTLEYG